MSTAPSTETVEVAAVDSDTERSWVTIVWNDPVNLMSYVVYVFVKLLGHARPVAEKLTSDVHHKGRAAVSTGTREEMELAVAKLQGAGLWATLQQDS